MAGSREQAAAMELAGYSSKEAPVVDDQELGSDGADIARIERVYKYVHDTISTPSTTSNRITERLTEGLFRVRMSCSPDRWN